MLGRQKKKISTPFESRDGYRHYDKIKGEVDTARMTREEDRMSG